MWIRDRLKYALHNDHGFGIVDRNSGKESPIMIFYEDGAYLPGDDPSEHDAINYLKDFGQHNWSVYKKKETQEISSLVNTGNCQFKKIGDKVIQAVIGDKQNSFKIAIEKEKNNWYYSGKCSCKKTDCHHTKAAGILLENRLEKLEHSYIVTDQPVGKFFVEPALCRAVENLEEGELDENLIRREREIIHMVDYANSDDYYGLFHNYLLDLDPPYEYDSRFLEIYYGYLLVALFEDAGYRHAVLDSGSYADQGEYEDRQHRSNRVSFKRTLKEYQKVIKEMDVRKDYCQNSYKEFILKYRGDDQALLHYYAVGKKRLSLCDLPFLEKIAECEDIDFENVVHTALKLDEIGGDQQVETVFRRLAKRLPPSQRVALYSNLRTITIPMEEIRDLPIEDQQKMINAAPLSVENINYVYDHLLADGTDHEKGRYLLRTVDRLDDRTDRAVKETIVRKAAGLPDNRLLFAYVLRRTNLKEKSGRLGQSGKMKDHLKPDLVSGAIREKELSSYFDCDYQLVNEGDSFYTLFCVMDPESHLILLAARETNGKLQAKQDTYSGFSCPAELIRKVALAGREEKYRKEAELCQEAVDAFRFEKDHKKFAADYQRFCSSLTEEKILFTEEAKADIEWYFYRNDTSNALAFRVGHRRMYVVKDAPEFIKAFKSGQTTEYGKDLILMHDPDNLDKTDGAAIRVLLAAKYTKGRKGDKHNKRYISVGDSVVGNLFELLSGRMIWLNDEPALLRLNPVKIRLKINKKYSLTTSLKQNQEFWNLDGKGYVISRPGANQTVIVDQMDGTVEETNLVDLVETNPTVCIRPILPDFKKNIYQRYFDMIDVEPSIIQSFEMSQLRFQTYFDFEKSKVTAKTRIFRDNVEIPVASLTARMDRMKYDLLENYLSELGFSDGIMEEEGHVLSFFKMDFTKLKKLTNVYLSESLKRKELRSIGKQVIRVSYKNNLVNVFLEKSEYDESDMEKIIQALRRKKKYILLSGDRIIDLDSAAAKDLGETVGDFGMDPKDLYRKKTISMVTAIKAFSHEKSCSIDKYLRDMIGEIRSFKDAEVSVPKLQGELRDYQIEGFKWLSVLSKYRMGGILADDMGLGKTIQIIALIRSDRTGKPSLVVCPKSLVFNWISEFACFDATTRVTAIYGPESKRSETIASIHYNEKAVYITSYESLRNDIEKYSGAFQYAILDEAQFIKNIHAQKTRSVKEIRAQHRFALTGTPIENSVVDLWSIFDFIMPGYFEELTQFKDRDTADIARKAAPFILRRVKEDVLEDLPSKYERILSADMSNGQRKLYEAMRLDARKQLTDGGKAFDILPYLTRLRQLCVDPALVVDDYSAGSGKMDMLKTLIPEYLQNNHRILIFSQFVKALEEVQDMLTNLGISTYFLSGATSAKDRVQMMDSFNNGSGTDVFLISLKAGGTGLNLTGADTVIHLDPWWNVAAEDQASDRAHRIGQTRNVEVIKLIAADSIEQRVLELQNIKKEVISKVISDNDGSVTSASLEDIAFVLE